MSKELHLGTSKLWCTMGKSKETEAGSAFTSFKEEIGEPCFEQNFTGEEQEFEIVVVSSLAAGGD